jgi:DGQHR domain-containing protein
MAKRERRIIRRRALRIEQDKKHPLFLFSLTGEELLEIAEISRISRDAGGRLVGYQRPEVRRHINNIVEYLNTGPVLFPNSIILAFSKKVSFIEARGPKVDDGIAIAGTLEIPVSQDREEKPAWIVDGQQRAIALSRTKTRGLAIPVNAFVAEELDLQREQFLRINSAKPLRRGLITELLPTISASLPATMAVRRIPSALCDVLNEDQDSPFRGMIKRASSAGSDSKTRFVSDEAIVAMLTASIESPSGCLFPYRNIATGQTDFVAIRKLLLTYWGAVKSTFPNAWGLSPSRSRLMHGAGIRAMGQLMDRVMGTLDLADPRLTKHVERELDKVRGACQWTSGSWDLLNGKRWNDIQNTPNDIRLLSNALVRTYLSATAVHA